MGLKINVSKTKIMNLNGQRIHTAANVNDIQIEWVTEFNYLGSQFTTKGTCEHDIKERIKKGRTRLRELGPVIKSNMLTLRSKKALIESCIFPIVYYGSENWRTNESLIRKLEALHNACTRTARNVDKKDHIRMDSISIR